MCVCSAQTGQGSSGSLLASPRVFCIIDSSFRRGCCCWYVCWYVSTHALPLLLPSSLTQSCVLLTGVGRDPFPSSSLLPCWSSFAPRHPHPNEPCMSSSLFLLLRLLPFFPIQNLPPFLFFLSSSPPLVSTIHTCSSSPSLLGWFIDASAVRNEARSLFLLVSCSLLSLPPTSF